MGLGKKIKNWGRKFDDAVTQPVARATEDAARSVWNAGTQTVGDVAGSITGSQKVEDILSGPSWDDMGTPGEAFYNEFNEGAGILPPSWRQYAAPVVGAALNFVPGVGPLLSAGFNTAYNAGGMQANQKGMDWGKVGKDAAINFGTAAAQMGATKLISNANIKAQNSANFRTSPSGMRAGFDASQPALGWKEAATINAGGLPSTATAARGSAMLGSSMSGFNTAESGETLLDGSRSLIADQPANATNYPRTVDFSAGEPSGTMASFASLDAPSSTAALSKLQFSPMDRVYKGAVGATPGVANQALTSTLAPAQATPLSGFSASEGAGTAVNGYNFGDELSAFGDANIMNTPNPTGPRIGSSAIDAMVSRRGANAYLQLMGARDQALPAGQTLPEPNTPYSNRQTEINRGADKSMEDLSNEIKNYNAYWGILDSNPNLVPSQMDQYVRAYGGDRQTPDLTQLDPGTPPLQDAMLPYFQGIQPMSMFNTSMIR